MLEGTYPLASTELKGTLWNRSAMSDSSAF